MKVLWVGDADVSSGFARCTHAACDALHAAGHEVHVLGLNYWGDPHDHPYKIWPCHQPLDGGNDAWGCDRLPRMIARLRPDVVVILQDPWNISGYLREFARQQLPAELTPPVVGWLAVDATNQRGKPLNDLSHVVVWTDFAAEELKRGGYTGAISVVPLGVDSAVFRPGDRAAARARVMPEGYPEDIFLVGAVGRNQYRKRLDLTIEYFAEWVHREHIDNAHLYLHVGPTGERGVDIASLVRYHGLQGRVVLATPEIGHGVRSQDLALVYNALDVYVTTTQGEGWGLPTLEAMACGVPCIVPDWSGLGSWVRDAAAKVPCTATALNAPMNGFAYTVGGIADRAQFCRELDSMYRSEVHREALRRRGLKLAAGLTWDRTGEHMVAVLESFMRLQAQRSGDRAERAPAEAAAP